MWRNYRDDEELTRSTGDGGARTSHDRIEKRGDELCAQANQPRVTLSIWSEQNHEKRSGCDGVIVQLDWQASYGVLNSRTNYAGQVDSLTIGMTDGGEFTPPHRRGSELFAANGIAVTSRNMRRVQRVDGMMNGEVDMATAAEFVVVNQAFTNARIRTIESSTNSCTFI